MEMSFQSWRPGTDEFVPHHVLGDYIQDAAAMNGVLVDTQFNTRVTKVVKQDAQWRLETARLSDPGTANTLHHDAKKFDALVVATGHYHACNVPELPGLGQWISRFPAQIWHSKLYCRADAFQGQNVLLIGAGVSSLDIAKDIGSVAANVFQSSRGGMYDLPSHLLPDNAARIEGIRRFEPLSSDTLDEDGTIPGTITMSSGRTLCRIHQIILCTGYHVSFPFMRQYHTDGVQPEEANEEVLVTNGQVTHNLHKDIWYIPDPSIAFATFSLFEHQAMAVAAVFSGAVALPSKAAMRGEYQDRVRRKGAGRTLHSLKGAGQEGGYVAELVAMVNKDLARSDTRRMSGHSVRWLEAYARRRVRQEALSSKTRDGSLDERVMKRIALC
ncbi:hypothetical protein LTR53_004186 [Teratosphaeriaceae sp. CCFEE 6253]|nr:hypothetical protein LTR53_004186 [Teratosphaeriaceae sp. CCFEE 6253]